MTSLLVLTITALLFVQAFSERDHHESERTHLRNGIRSEGRRRMLERAKFMKEQRDLTGHIEQIILAEISQQWKNFDNSLGNNASSTAKPTSPAPAEDEAIVPETVRKTASTTIASTAPPEILNTGNTRNEKLLS